MFKLDQIIRQHKDVGDRPRGGPPVSRALWERALGSRIAARAQPLKLDRGQLLVRVSNASWANELSMLSDDIRRQLAAEGVRVDSLRFVVGQLDPQYTIRKALPARTAPPADVQPPDNVRREASGMEAPLKSAVEHAAAASLWLAHHDKSRSDPPSNR